MNLNIIDIVFVIFLLLMAILGYIKGFVTRLYDLIGTVIVLFLSYFLAKPLSSIFMIYKYDQQDILATMVGQMVNHILVFIILLIILMVIKKLLGIFIKPALKGLMNTFSLTSLVDKVLGVVLSIIEGVFIAYLALVFVVIPFTDSGAQKVQNTVFAKQVVNLVPNVSGQVMDFAQIWHSDNQTDHSTENLAKLMLMAKNMNLIDDEQMKTIFQEHIQKDLQQKNITLTPSQKQQLEDILRQAGYQKSQLESILSKINVSDES